MTQVNLVLVLCPLYDLIHGGEAFLHLLHESTFPFQTLLLITLQLIHKTHQLDLQLILRISNVFSTPTNLLLHLTVNLIEDILLLYS